MLVHRHTEENLVYTELGVRKFCAALEFMYSITKQFTHLSHIIRGLITLAFKTFIPPDRKPGAEKNFLPRPIKFQEDLTKNALEKIEFSMSLLLTLAPNAQTKGSRPYIL